MMNKNPSWGNIEELKLKLAMVREMEGQATSHCGELYRRPGHQRRLETVNSVLRELVPKCDFIDVGCAEGLYCGISKEYGARSMLGIDISPTKIQKAIQLYPSCMFLCRDAAHLEEFANQFDVALCSEVLQHVVDYEIIAQAVFECLRPGGCAIFTVPNLSLSADHVPASISSDMSEQDLLAEVGGAGLGKQNAVWKFNSTKLYRDLVTLCNAILVQEIPIDTPDGQRKNLWTIGLFQRPDCPILLSDEQKRA